MLKKYRHRFVVLNMGVIGLVMLITFTMIGAEICRNDYSELKNVMTLILKPWNTSNQSSGNSEEKKPPSKKPDSKDNQDNTSNAPPKPRGNGSSRNRYKDDNITTIFYDEKEDEISILSETLSFDGDVEDVVNAVIQQKESYGTIYEYHVIYYKEKSENNYKMAVTDISYISSHMIKIVITLVLAFIVSMILLLYISVKLSKIAAKPMENAIEMERRFVADISHDLKTPITVILANNSILKNNSESRISQNIQWIESTDTSAKEMMYMVNEMLTLSSLESADKSVEKQNVNLSSVSEKCVLQLESVAYERGVIIEEEIAENMMILSNAEYTRRICSSLLENALKYEPDGGRILIKTYMIKKKVVFSVQNFGSVIAAEDLPHIFDRFYRGDKTRNVRKGYGLGLTIIRQMTELLGAELDVESSEQCGTIFTVTFEAVS